MPLASLPPELHALVLHHALPDEAWFLEESGHDGISSTKLQERKDVIKEMLLVSRYWHQLARPFRFRILRLVGFRDLSIVIRRLKVTEENISRVHTLILTDSPRVFSADDEADRTTAFEHDVLCLLMMLAPTLQTLVLRLSNPAYATSLFSELWSTDMPKLCMLSVTGLYAYPSIAPTTSAPFPRLQCLRLEGLHNPSGLLTFTSLRTIFPKLEVMEILGLRAALSFARELASVVQDEQKARMRLPLGLRMIRLYLAPQQQLKFRKPSARNQMLHIEMQKTLLLMLSETRLKGGIKVEIREAAVGQV